MKPSILWTLFTILIVICILAAHHFLGVSRRQEHRKAILLKGITGLCFCRCRGADCVCLPDRHFALPVMAGLILDWQAMNFWPYGFCIPPNTIFALPPAEPLLPSAMSCISWPCSTASFPLLRASIPVGAGRISPFPALSEAEEYAGREPCRFP